MAVSIRIEDAKLRKMIAATKGKKPVRIVADGVEYGVYQELGTSRMTARPTAAPAVEAVRPGFEQAFKGDETFMRAEQIVEKTAHDVERLWKQGIVQKNIIDTGAYLNSIRVYEGKEIDFG